MTWKFVVTAALACASVFSTINNYPELFQGLFHGLGMRSSSAEVSQRQLIDAKLPITESQTIKSPIVASQSFTLPTTDTLSADTAELPAIYNLDMPQMTMAFGSNDLNDLIARGSTLLPLPDTSPLELRLVSVVNRHGIEQIRAEHQGMVSTITRRGDKFFATVSSPRDSYRIEGGLSQSLVFPHRLLAQRTIRHATDYRYVQ